VIVSSDELLGEEPGLCCEIIDGRERRDVTHFVGNDEAPESEEGTKNDSARWSSGSAILEGVGGNDGDRSNDEDSGDVDI